MTNGAMRLREMERAAKQAKRGIWTNYVPVNTGQTKLSDSFLGKVVEVVSGDTLVVKDINGGGVERRVSLSRCGGAGLICLSSLPRSSIIRLGKCEHTGSGDMLVVEDVNGGGVERSVSLSL